MKSVGILHKRRTNGFVGRNVTTYRSGTNALHATQFALGAAALRVAESAGRTPSPAVVDLDIEQSDGDHCVSSRGLAFALEAPDSSLWTHAVGVELGALAGARVLGASVMTLNKNKDASEIEAMQLIPSGKPSVSSKTMALLRHMTLLEYFALATQMHALIATGTATPPEALAKWSSETERKDDTRLGGQAKFLTNPTTSLSPRLQQENLGWFEAQPPPEWTRFYRRKHNPDSRRPEHTVNVGESMTMLDAELRKGLTDLVSSGFRHHPEVSHTQSIEGYAISLHSAGQGVFFADYKRDCAVGALWRAEMNETLDDLRAIRDVLSPADVDAVRNADFAFDE